MSEKQAKRMRQFWRNIPKDEKFEILSEMGKTGGKASVKVRMGKLTPEQRSIFMQKVRKTGILKKKLKEQLEKKYDISKNGDNPVN